MSERVVNVAELIAPSFDNLFYDVQEHRYTHYWLAGGRWIETLGLSRANG